MKFLQTLGYIFLAIFLFAIHTQLLYWLQPDFKAGIMQEFSWLNFTEKNVQSIIFGALFGGMTVTIIATKKTNIFYKLFIIAVAILDSLAVFYQNEGDLLPAVKMLFASIHYAAYTAFVILVFGLIPSKEIATKLQSNNYAIASDEIELQVKKLLKQGIPGIEIAEKLGIHPSRVSRIKKKLK